MGKAEMGMIIKKLREKKNITQNILAGVVEVTSQAVSNWERGEAYPDIETIPKIAKYFDVSTDRLFGISNNIDENLDKGVEKSLEEEVEIAVFESDNESKISTIMEICWAMQKSRFYEIREDIYNCEDYDADEIKWANGQKNLDSVMNFVGDGGQNISSFEYNDGFHIMRFGKSLSFFCAMQESKEGFWDKLSYKENYIKLFAFMAEEKNLKTLYYIHSLKVGTRITVEHIEEKIKISNEEASLIIENLYKYNFLRRKKVEEEMQYRAAPKAIFVAFLALTETITNTPEAFYGEPEEREKTYLNIRNLDLLDL